MFLVCALQRRDTGRADGLHLVSRDKDELPDGQGRDCSETQDLYTPEDAWVGPGAPRKDFQTPHGVPGSFLLPGMHRHTMAPPLQDDPVLNYLIFVKKILVYSRE